MFEPIRPVRAYERVVQQVEEAILRGLLRPGERLPSEREMMQQFDVGRSTLREALRVLQSNGWIQSRPGDPHGPSVLPFTTDNLKKSISSLVRIEHLSLGELLQFRMLVEGCSAQLAATLRTNDQLTAMDAAMERMEAAIGEDYESFSKADLMFHDTMAEIAHNKLLQVCNEVVHDVVLKLVSTKLVDAADRAAQMRDSCRRHALVLEAVRDGDSQRAAWLARKHIFEYYADYLEANEVDRVAALVGRPSIAQDSRGR